MGLFCQLKMGVGVSDERGSSAQQHGPKSVSKEERCFICRKYLEMEVKSIPAHQAEKSVLNSFGKLLTTSQQGNSNNQRRRREVVLRAGTQEV